MCSSTVLRGGELSSSLCVRFAFWRVMKDSVLHFAQIPSLLATKGPTPGLTIVAAALSLACWRCCLPRAVLSIENHPSLLPCVLLVPLLWGLALRCGCAGGQGWNKGLSFWLQALAPQAWRRNSLLIVPHREGLAYYFLKGVGKAMCRVKNHRQKWKPLSLVTTWCDGNRRSLKAEQEPSALSPFFPWSRTPTRRRGEGWWSCRPRALAALWTPKLRAVGKGRPQNRKMLGVESLGADPSFTGGLGGGTWRSCPPENWDKSPGDEDSAAGNGNVWRAPDQGPASSAAALLRDCTPASGAHAQLRSGPAGWSLCRLPWSVLQTHTTQDCHQQPDSSVTLASSWCFYIQACILKAAVWYKRSWISV